MRSGDDVAWISMTEMHSRIHAKRGNALLVSEDDWRAIQETPLSQLDSWHAGVEPGRDGGTRIRAQ